MLHPDASVWRDHIILTRDLATPGERSDFCRRARRGDYVAVRPGAYVPADQWHGLGAAEQHLTRVRANLVFSDRDLVFSHHSAAVLWRLPWFGELPARVHVVDEKATGGRSTSVLARHAIGVPTAVERIDGVGLTTLARTVSDVASVATFAQSVVVADAALRRSEHPIAAVPETRVTREDLLRELDHVPLRHGQVKARRAIEFADGAADRPGESLSRTNMLLAGLTMPRLQKCLRGASGKVYWVDFWWPEFRLIGEFDGKAKYTEAQFLGGRTPSQALYDEKKREDDLRATGKGFTRWPWEVAISMPRLRHHLQAAGVR